MFGLLEGFQLISPFYLAGLILTPLLVYAYLRKTPLQKKVVSSLILLKSLKRREAPKTKFKPPFRFFLELLALILLCIAAAMPLRTDISHRTALLLDNTLSMRALDTTGRTPASRLDRAKEAAKKWLGEQRSSTTVDLFTSSPKLVRVGAEQLSLSSAESSLKDIRATNAADNLEAEVEELGDSGDYERVVVISDKSIEFRDGENPVSTLFSAAGAEKKLTRTVGITVGERTANIFVSSFSLVQGTLGEDNGKLSAMIGAAGQGPQNVKVVFSELGEKEEILAAQNVSVSPGRPTEVNAALPPGARAKALYKVRIAPANEPAGSKNDSLIEDNIAWLVPQSAAGEKVLVVTPDESAGTGLEHLSAFAVEVVTPQRFSELPMRSLETYALIIFHRTAPSAPPPRPTLLILPPPDNTLFPVATEVQSAAVSSWVSEHPITSYMKVPLLKIGAAELFAVPAWAEAVIRAEQGALVVAGESRGVRFAAVGTELFPFEGSKTPVLSVLTLNLLNWLSGGTELTGGTLAGATLALDPKLTWRVRDPSGQERAVSGENAKVTFSEPGPYRIRSGAEEKLVAANVFFPDESSTFTTSSFATKHVFEREKKIEEGGEPWWPYLLAGALLLLLVEQLLFLAPDAKPSELSAEAPRQ